MFVFISHMAAPEADRAGLEQHFRDREISGALFADDPALMERFSESGRAKRLPDMHYCLERCRAAGLAVLSGAPAP